ncbi:MAG: 50S ribosomal protein L3 [Chloroflexi bacterium]|nr:50S ribosomal protein L3 [Chloroflexota bacterium]
MLSGLIGRKIGMTHFFGAESQVVPVTVLEVGPCVVTQVRTATRDKYDAVQIGFGRAKALNQPASGHLKASGAQVKHLREFRADDVSAFSVGQTLNVTQFQEGDLVDVTSTTKGRGFQGVMKRHGFAGGKRSHGQKDRDRAPGSIGAGTFPGRVVKGKRMPGHMGNRRVTARKLRVEKVDGDRNLLMVRGAVPGARSTLVTVSYTRGVPLAERVSPEELVAAEEPQVEETATAEAEEAVVEETPAEEPTAEAEEPAVDETPAEEPTAEAEEPATDETPAEDEGKK